MLLTTQLTGCYRYVQVASPSRPAVDLQVGLTDRGRTALAPTLGPGVVRIGGRGVESTDSSMVLSVTSVQYIGARGQGWTGERLEISRDHITEIRERRLSRARSWVLAGIVTAVAVLVSTISITGYGDDDGGTRPGGGEPGTQ